MIVVVNDDNKNCGAWMDFLIILSLLMTAPAFPIYESSDFGRTSAITFIKSVSQADPISLFQRRR
jgi:hypothetical protein